MNGLINVLYFIIRVESTGNFFDLPPSELKGRESIKQIQNLHAPFPTPWGEKKNQRFSIRHLSSLTATCVCHLDLLISKCVSVPVQIFFLFCDFNRGVSIFKVFFHAPRFKRVKKKNRGLPH